MAEPQPAQAPSAPTSPQPALQSPAASPSPHPRLPLPPGRTGLPLLGETLPFLKNGFGFVAERVSRHGPIFRTRILGRETAVLAGPDASGRFIDSEVQRAGAMPPHVQELFGGSSLPLLDGDAHLSRKTFILQAFTREALAAYLPVVDRMVGEALERWAGQDEIVWIPELKRLALEVICAAVIGIPPGPRTEALRRDYQLVLRAFSALPIPAPGTTFSRGRAAMGRILACFEEVIREHQEPRAGDRTRHRPETLQPRDDGLSRILAATDGAGRPIGMEECKTELHHFVIAGLIVFAELGAMVQQLTGHPEVRARLQAEIDGLPQAEPAGMRFETLAAAPYLMQVVMEVKRLCPILPVLFGKARESFEFKGHTVPAGWMVLWGHRASLVSAEVYSEPERFDPERFAAGRAEHRRHPFAFVPHGAGPAHGHRCPGTDLATCLMQVFTVRLLRGYTWELTPGQDLALDWSVIPPEPKDGLRARLRRR